MAILLHPLWVVNRFFLCFTNAESDIEQKCMDKIQELIQGAQK